MSNITISESYEKILNDCHDYMNASLFTKGCLLQNLNPYPASNLKDFLIGKMSSTKDACGQVLDITAFGIYLLLQKDLFPDSQFVSLNDVSHNETLKTEFLQLQDLHDSNEENCILPDLMNTLATLNIQHFSDI